MAKIVVPNINTSLDPVAEQIAAGNRLGLIPISSAKKFSVDEQSDRLNSFSDVNADDYGKNTSLFGSDAEAQSTLDEVRAQRQSSAEQLLKGLGHIGSTLGTEILKTPGYLLGGFSALANDKSVIENIVDNDWINAMERLDSGIKEQIPVYLTKEVQEGNIGRKLMSSAWWATTGADGIGFLLSMYAPGQLLKAVNIGAKIGDGLQAIAKNAKLAKVLTSANILKQDALVGAKITAKGIERANSVSAVMMNTYIESAAEAANTFDNARKTFLEANPNATDEEASALASKAAANVMKANVGVLLLSNMFDELFLFKGFGKSAEEVASSSTLGKVIKNGIFNPEEIAKLKKAGVKDFLKQVPGKLAVNFGKEGLFEEGLQTQIQKYYENVASGKTKGSFTEDVLGDYFENLMTDPEMQESVVLGGILGGGASMFGLASEIKSKNDFLFGKGNSTPSFIGRLMGKKEKNTSKGFVNIMNENFINSARTIHDIADKDENGQTVMEDGKVKVNEEKLKQLVEQKEGLLVLNQLHNLAVLEGNKDEAAYFGDLLSYNYFLPFLQQEGGYETLQQHISNQLVEVMAKKQEAITRTPPSQEQKDETKANLLKKATEYNEIYKTVDTTTNTELDVPVDNPTTYSGWKDSVRNRKMQALVSYNSAKRALDEILLTVPNVDEDVDIDKLSPIDAVKYHVAKISKNEYEQRLKEAKIKYVELSEKKTLQEDYAKFKADIQEDIKKVEEAVAEDTKETEKTLENEATVNNLISKITTAGYQPGEIGMLEDEYGDRYKFNPATNKVTDVLNREVKDISNLSVIPKEKVATEVATTQEFIAKQEQVDQLQQIAEIKNAYQEEEFNIESELAELKSVVANIIVDKVKGKNKLKKQHKIDKELLEKARYQTSKYVDFLSNRIQYLNQIPQSEELILKTVALRGQYDDLSDVIDIAINTHSSFKNIINSNVKGIEVLDSHFSDLSFPYEFSKIKENASKDLNKVIKGDTLVKNNVATNVLEIIKQLQGNSLQSILKLGKEVEPNINSVISKIEELLEPFINEEALTPEQRDALDNKVFLTNAELDSIASLLDIKDNTEFDKFQTELDKTLQKEYVEASAEVLDKTVDASQKQDITNVEIADEAPNMREIFLDHALPSTPFSTTGISVLYDNKGKDVIDENGFPTLNDNAYQKLWFETIDKLADTITDYTLTPIRAMYDNSDDIQLTLAANFLDISKRTPNDIFVFLTDKNGNKVKVNGRYVFTSIRKVDEVYPLTGKPRVVPDYVLNQYLNSIGVYGVYSYDATRNEKIDTFVQGKEARTKLKDLIDNNNTGEDLFTLAIEHGRKEYQEFLRQLTLNKDTNLKLQIEDTTTGYPLYQLDKEGKKMQHDVFDAFPSIKLIKNKFGKDQLQGGKIGVIVNTQLKIKNKFVKLPQGSVYLQFDNDEFVVLQSRKLETQEIDTVLYLLSLADSNKPLNTISVSLPEGQKYVLNGKNIGNNLPVFFKKAQVGDQSFSLLETMINYGLRPDTKNKKGEIFIQSGNVVFTDFNGGLHKVKLTDVSEAIKNKDYSKIKELTDFLAEKKFNINNTMIANNPTFHYPIFKDGKLSFKSSDTYYDFILNDVLSTSSLEKPGYPRRLQRNIVYSNKLEQASKATIKQEAAKPVVIEPSKGNNKQELIDRQIVGFKAFVAANPDGVTRETLIEKLRNNTGLKKKFNDIGSDYTDVEINTIVDGILGVTETKTEEAPRKKMTPAERLAQMKNESIELGTTPSVDKRIDPEELLEKYIKNKIIQKICK